jgi:double-stranded uracil-DNA glycosylase
MRPLHSRVRGVGAGGLHSKGAVKAERGPRAGDELLTTPRSADPWRPTRAQLESARGKKINDVIAPGLRVLFCGINPGLYSGAVGHHFARPGNRFWPVLYRAGFTDRKLSPFDERELLEVGLGITNLVNRTTSKASELDDAELRHGAATLRRKAARSKPRVVAVLGVTAFRAAFEQRHAAVGPQAEKLGPSSLWVLPNPSGLNAHYQLPELTAVFAALRADTGGQCREATRKRRILEASEH